MPVTYNEAVLDDEYRYLRKKLLERASIDLAAYKERQMRRRLEGYLKRVNAASFFELARRIQKDDAALRQLVDFLTINVSEFFRNPDRFDDLATRVLPLLNQAFGSLRIWSAGCSIGAEPYSLAILLLESRLHGDHRILATDIDQNVLAQAEQGIYEGAFLREVSQERLQRFFDPVDEGRWRVKSSVKRLVAFRRHNLLEDPYPQDQHLIVCRNVVIYFTDEAKQLVYARFAEALAPGGFLLLGGTESIFRPQRFGLQPAGPFLYRRIEGADACDG